VRIRPVVTDEIVYLDADEEEKFHVAQANAPLDEDFRFAEERVPAR
jgi:DNA-directed RNA polymerase subunit beta